MKRSELKELHYITPISNVPSICEHGILSNEDVKKLGHTSIAKKEVQNLRSKVVVPGGKPLHTYVNLYFDARNPMMFSRKAQHSELCVLTVSLDVLDLKGVVVTDENAASTYVRFAAAPSGLANVSKELTFARKWTDSNQIEYWKKKSAKCAEVLVPRRVEPKYLRSAYVSCEESLRVFGELGVPIEASANPDLFFR